MIALNLCIKSWPTIGKRILLFFFIISLLTISNSKITNAQEGNYVVVWTASEGINQPVVSWADWDNDGDLDLAVGNYLEPVRIYENTNIGLSLVWISPYNESTGWVEWGDLDGDGDLDLLVGNIEKWDHLFRVYFNTGGDLTSVWAYPITGYLTTSDISLGDWDNDGTVDIAWAYSYTVEIYSYDGNTFQIEKILDTDDYTHQISWVDWEPDGDLDLTVYEDIYKNEGGDLVLTWQLPQPFGYDPVWADWDNDGDFDLANNEGVYQKNEDELVKIWTAPADIKGWGIAWGNIDGDNDLDLALGDTVYLYNETTFTFEAFWTMSDAPRSLDWCDWDKDGDLDLAVGTIDDLVRVYANIGTLMQQIWSAEGVGVVSEVAWGDIDNDHGLELAIAHGTIDIYSNINGELNLSLNIPTYGVTDIALGNWDEDSDLDLAVNGTESGYGTSVYTNNDGNFSVAWSEEGYPTSLAWGDWDGDGDLDLAIGSNSGIKIISNIGGNFEEEPAWTSDDSAAKVAWGDWDGDGDLDLATINGTIDWPGEPVPGPLFVYSNDNGEFTLAWSSDETGTCLAWGDWDGDGDLDILLGNYEFYGDPLDGEPLYFYSNDNGKLMLAGALGETNAISSIALGDMDGDWDLDLAIGNDGYSLPGNYLPLLSKLYNNRSGEYIYYWASSEEMTKSLAWGDWDIDGDLDLVLGNDGTTTLYENRLFDTPSLANNITWAQIDYPGGDPAPDSYAGFIREGQFIDLNYRLFDLESNPAKSVKGLYSIDGGNSWHEAMPTPETLTTNLASSPLGVPHTFVWDIYSSGFFGTSNSVIFRLDVYQAFTGPKPYQYIFRSSRTLPFRLRGSQVRVLDNNGDPIAGAIVYYQLEGQTSVFEPYVDQFDQPFTTNPAGYLNGYGEIHEGDKLVALYPVQTGEYYTLYHTSTRPPTPDGFEPYVVNGYGIQPLTVSADNKLILFNLNVSLEWDARSNTPDLSQFESQLEYDLKRSSEFLYDWSNGQAALGEVNVYHNRENWEDAHIRIYASNRLRPNASMGGVVSEDLEDPGPLPNPDETIIYEPGQVHMSVVWNRYGDPGGNLGEDWPKALAHELGHYLLFLDDNYLGLDESGQLISVETCPGAMSDPYRADYSEFHHGDNWDAECGNTLANKSTGRFDWQTITTFYPGLDPITINPGPNLLPLAVTQVNFNDLNTPPDTLETPIFFLTQGSQRIQPGPSAQVFLFQGNRLLDLGSPVLDQVFAHGAKIGDTLCVYELQASRLGCEVISEGDDQLELYEMSDWKPNLEINPVTAKMFNISVSNLPEGLSLKARLYSLSDPALPAIRLDWDGSEYKGPISSEISIPEGYVHLYVEGSDRREMVANYALGGSPGHRWPRFGRRWARFAPAISSDGQAIIFGDNLQFEEGQFFGIQAIMSPPEIPAWATQVGLAYRLFKSENAPDLEGTTISFNYLGNQVPPGEEEWVKIYYWTGVGWQDLPTEIDLSHNVASAPTQGEGIYALMSTIEVSLHGPGWDLLAYPVNETRTVEEVLQSIDGSYTTVYGYQYSDSFDPWKVYDVSVPDWVNDLVYLEFGRSYWIYLTEEDVILRMRGSGFSSQKQPALPDQLAAIGAPPATFYGTINEPMEIMDGETIYAWINNHQCGQGQNMTVDGQEVYSVNVFAEGSGDSEGCGIKGRTVIFQVGTQPNAGEATWDNNQLWELNLSAVIDDDIFLPLIFRFP